MSRQNLRELAVLLIKLNLIVLAVNVAIEIAVTLLIGAALEVDALGFMSTLLFIESGIFLLVGGAVEMTSPASFSKVREQIFRTKSSWAPEDHRKGERSALRYILIGVLLLAESVLIAFLV